MIKKIKSIYDKYNKKYNLDKYLPVFLYLFFGVVSTIVNIGVYAICSKLFHIEYMISNIIAWISAVIVAYVTNKKYVFENDTPTFKSLIYEMSKFLFARIFTLGLDIATMYVGVSLLGIDDLIMKCLANVIVIVTNYFMSKLVVFTSKKNDEKGNLLNEKN